jgi:hypothetical protein
MTDKKSPEPLPERTHPYSVRMQLVFGSNIELLLDGDDVRLPFAGSYTLRIIRERTPVPEETRDQTRIAVHLDAFASASEAERAGRLLTTSFLWFAAFKRVTIGFRKRTGDYLFAIRDRTQSAGITGEGKGRFFYKVAPDELASVAEQAFKAEIDVSQSVLISMEFFAAARLESTQRARFISLMTALEALAEQADYGDELGKVLFEFAREIESHPKLQGPDMTPLRTSLSGRIRQLRTESVRQAILRTVRQHVDDENAVRFVDKAYGIRSKMLHEGHQVAELPALCNGIESVLVRVYSSMLQLPLKHAGVEV